MEYITHMQLAFKESVYPCKVDQMEHEVIQEDKRGIDILR